MLKNFIKGFAIGATLYIVILVGATASTVCYINENGWNQFIHKYPLLAGRMINETGVYCSPDHCMEAITFEDSKVNPDPDIYWEEPEIKSWVHYKW